MAGIHHEDIADLWHSFTNIRSGGMWLFVNARKHLFYASGNSYRQSGWRIQPTKTRRPIASLLCRFRCFTWSTESTVIVENSTCRSDFVTFCLHSQCPVSFPPTKKTTKTHRPFRHISSSPFYQVCTGKDVPYNPLDRLQSNKTSKQHDYTQWFWL